jgi:hypothetical protein
MVKKPTMADVGKSRGGKLYDNTPAPAGETDDGRKRLDNYHLELGRFVGVFAQVEMAMHLVLRWQTKVSIDVSRAVFSGVKADQASSFLRRLADIGQIKQPEWKELEPVLAQLNHINKTRNLILHYGADGVAEGEGISSDEGMALTLDRVRRHPVSPEIIAAMTADARKIFFCLVAYHAGRPAPISTYANGLRRAPWRYKPPQPKKTDPHPPQRGRSAKPPPPPRSSGA